MRREVVAVAIVPLAIAASQIVPLLMTGSSFVPIAILGGSAVLTSAAGVLAVALGGLARGARRSTEHSGARTRDAPGWALLKGWVIVLLLVLPTGVLVAGTMLAQDLLVAVGVMLVIAAIVVVQVMLVLAVGRPRGAEREVGPSWAP